ncbi:hypothetical protein KM043_016847 [Ampulex compressa]|nr:hypothetical protein KM043_016847 [Ampulex compressa]
MPDHLGGSNIPSRPSVGKFGGSVAKMTEKGERKVEAEAIIPRSSREEGGRKRRHKLIMATSASSSFCSSSPSSPRSSPSASEGEEYVSSFVHRPAARPVNGYGNAT